MIEVYQSRIEHAILRGIIKQLSWTELLSNLDLTFSQYYSVRLEIISQIKLKSSQEHTYISDIVHLIDKIIKLEKNLPSNKRPVADKTVFYLLEILPTDIKYKYITSFIEHSRKSRRTLGYRLIRDNYHTSHQELLIDNFNRYGDQYALQVLAQKGDNFAQSADFLLENLEETWMQSRVFEKLLIHDEEDALNKSTNYPIAFIWGAARASYKEAIPFINNLLKKMEDHNDYTHFSLSVWALEKLGAKKELLELCIDFDVTDELPMIESIKSSASESIPTD